MMEQDINNPDKVKIDFVNKLLEKYLPIVAKSYSVTEQLLQLSNLLIPQKEQVSIDSKQKVALQKIKFTAQEKEVLAKYMQGFSAKEIASIMYRSRRTIEGHLYRIKAKLAVSKRSEVFELVQKMQHAAVLVYKL